ncbi:TonB-dependent receptor [Salipiger sp. IMCC34102]|uniref:TonB-dependent receptor domain-containing protein n=1 Tax=Salipiger sp. IMCC34102 TaxID=2510647 RepID=UPI00101BEDB1|nr:TonB-dependent receptor [Salipiger sp. IMCC34102]RYH04471.1 TonB-dependent receptor [Salipiger sp. IMCC34102]
MRPSPSRGLTFLLLSTVAWPAMAQDAPIRLNEIVLGAGQPRVATETPQAVTVVGQDDIDRAQATTPAELFDDVPGIQAIGSERAAGLSFNIRGIGELAASDESKIIVTVDGTPKFHEQYRVGSFFGEPELYKRVEVLRGPASSTLYGAGAIGGTVAFETKDASDFLGPEDDNFARFRLGGQGNGEGGFGSAIFATRPNDRAEFLGALTYRTANDYDDGAGNPVPGSEFDAVSGLLKGTFQIDEAQSIRLSYQAFESDLDDTAYSATGTLDAFGSIDRRVFDQTATLNYSNTAPGNDLVDLDVTVFYSDTDVEQGDASAAAGPFSSPLFADANYAYETTGVKVENTSYMALGGGWDAYLTYGLQAQSQDRIAQTDMGTLGFHPEGTDTRLGAYFQGEFVNDRLTIVPGLRVDRSSLEPSDDVPGGRDEDITSVSPKLAALYKITDNFNVFGSVARTERAPTLDELYSTDDSDGETASLTLEPEDAQAVEVGLAYDTAMGQGRFGIKTTAFFYDIENLIERDSTAGTPYYRQVGEATIEGIEIEAGYQSETLFARAAYTYTDGEDEETGDRLQSIPAESLVLTAGTRLPDHGLELGWQGTFVDDISYAASDFSGYGVHDVYAEWSPQSGPLEGFGLRAGVENVFDREYRNSLAGDNGPGRNLEIALTRGFTF